jgi:hypothetical protein
MMDMNDLDMMGGIRNGTRAWIQKRKRKRKKEQEKEKKKGRKNNNNK